MSAVQIETSGSANRLCLDCTSLAKAALSCLALNLLTTNYKTITVIAFPKMTPVVVGASKRGQALGPGSPSVCSSSGLHSFPPTLLLSQLAAAETIDKITVLATGEQKVLTDEFLLWLNEIWKIVCGTAFKVKVQMAERISSGQQTGNKKCCWCSVITGSLLFSESQTVTWGCFHSGTSHAWRVRTQRRSQASHTLQHIDLITQEVGPVTFFFLFMM